MVGCQNKCGRPKRKKKLKPVKFCMIDTADMKVWKTDLVVVERGLCGEHDGSNGHGDGSRQDGKDHQAGKNPNDGKRLGTKRYSSAVSISVDKNNLHITCTNFRRI